MSTFIQSILAKASFSVYLFFLFFGTSLPFQEKIVDVRDVATSNPVNQFLFSFLYILSLVGLTSKGAQIAMFVKREKFLTLFLFWTFLSVFWSDSPFVSFKRWVQNLGTVIILFSALLYIHPSDRTFPYFKVILFIYIPVTFLSILIFPGAVQWEFPAWRGIAPHKNTLGQVALVSLIFWSYEFQKNDANRKTIAIAFWLLSLVLLFGSKSTTCLLTGSGIVLLAGLWHIKKSILQPASGGLISSTLLITFLSGLFLIFYLASDTLGSVFHFLGKDMTLTGRVELWKLVFEETKSHLLFGCGFEGFWISSHPFVEMIAGELHWIPNNSHLGYLDILNESGVVGAFVIILMVVFYFRNLVSLNKPHFWKWFVIGALILNLTESTLFRLHSLNGVMFTFSYMALYADLIRQE
ncbi:MAG: O-antigen ligase family protein [Deltaproteobacteria bacterium]|nr:O-antigen ligase family protein [Deltaproteobacteria bacterium]